MSSIVERLCERAKATPSQTAFEFLSSQGTQEHTLSYAQLERAASQVAAMLNANGVVAGERVLVICQPGLEYVSAFFGCLYAGAVAVPLYPPRNRLHVARVVSILKDAQARLLLCNGKGIERYADFFAELQVPVSALLSVESCLWEEGRPSGPAEQLPQNTAFLQYTSGTTGTPKGVMVSNANIAHNLAMLNLWLGGAPGERMVSWLPLYHDMGLIAGVLAPVMGGYPCVLMPPETFSYSPFYWLDTISRYQATISGGPNFSYSMCCQKISDEQLAALDLTRWRMAFNGAEPVRARTLAEFAARFAPSGFNAASLSPCYGLAEGTLIVAGHEVQRPTVALKVDRQLLQNEHRAVINPQPFSALAPECPAWRTLVSVGPVIGGQHLLIIDPASGAPLDDRRVGEICVSGGSVVGGYWQQPDISRQIFHTIRDQEGLSYVRTGDLGFMHEGHLYVTGRLKDMIIISGRNFYSEDIEQSVVSSQPKVVANSCAAFSTEHAIQESLVIVAEVERTERHGNLQEIIIGIQKEVWMKHEINPQTIVLVSPGQVPRTSSGKVRRKACRQAWAEGELKVLDYWDRHTEPMR
jgi:acyl-CoA synthetase (AMP-forming)/AMP-acid ligase II